MTEYLEQSPLPYLDGPRAVKLVHEYFKPNGRFTGRKFEFLGDGGDRPDVANALTAEDLVAVSMLSVHVPGEAAIELLETRAEEISELLIKVPLNVTLWDAHEADVDDHSSDAADLWHRIESITGVGWVTANKLLARKRPHLLPVYDRVVKAALQPSRPEFWIPLRNSILRNDRAVLNRLVEIKQEARLDVDPSLLRILDVAVWMSSGR